MNGQEAGTFLSVLGLDSPWMNAAGFLGYLPPARLEFDAPLGAFLPPPLTFQMRQPAENRALVQFAGGFLLHNALPNPGVNAAIKLYARRWARAKLPVWLHLFIENEEEAAQLSVMADELENVQAIEVEFPVRANNKARLAILNAACGEKPLLAVLPLNEADREMIVGCANMGVAGLVVAAPRGRLLKDGAWVNGRLYGPSLLPQVVLAVERYRKIGLPLLAGCGIYSVAEGEQLLKAGAAALQVDAALWI